jgi:signal transduction histidine kinase
VTVDQYMLHVLLMTLLYNGARRRVDDDEPVTLRIVVTETGLEFCVDDGLAPLPADIVDGLFEPRPELPRALHLPQFGLGLRLYAARRIARQMGGELEIVPGQGNRYQLRLPLQPPADDSTEAEI